MSFSKSQVKSFVKQAKDSVGDGWDLLVPKLKIALIEGRCLAVICGQAADTVSTDVCCALRREMLAEAGLNDEV